MQTIIPKASTALAALLRFDFVTQWRNRRSVVAILLIPVIILISWKGVVAKFGGAFVLSNCITIGLTAIGLMGYSISIARDRDKGIFQRLRVAPVPTWSIMVSRLLVQLAMILLVTTVVFIVGYRVDHIVLPASGYALGYLAALAGGALYLGLGQMIVGLLKNAETVNSATRLVYFVFIMVGMFGEMGMMGMNFKSAVQWSPYGAVKTILAASMQPETWNTHASLLLLVTLAYALVFSFLGIRWFKWNSR
jgi:ABC-2 type transport system permease protein